MKHMKIMEVHEQRIEGLRVRTSNADEADAARARIGALWADFAAQVAPHSAPGAVTYGVYHHYASDAQGAYDVLVGLDASQASAPTDRSGWGVVQIQSGPYAVFQAHGPMPQAVIEAWQRVWAFFAQPQCPHRRAYTTDFERYAADGAVDIHIALERT
jgi:predicted transcriptional regulator YdeE